MLRTAWAGRRGSTSPLAAPAGAAEQAQSPKTGVSAAVALELQSIAARLYGIILDAYV